MEVSYVYGLSVYGAIDFGGEIYYSSTQDEYPTPGDLSDAVAIAQSEYVGMDPSTYRLQVAWSTIQVTSSTVTEEGPGGVVVTYPEWTRVVTDSDELFSGSLGVTGN